MKQPGEDQLPQLMEYHKNLVEKGVAPGLELSTYEQFKLIKVYRDLQDFFP